MSLAPIRGVVPILLTPFDLEGRIDLDSLKSLIDFNIAAGVHGLGVALGSEIFKFNEAERSLVTRAVIDHVKGRVPVVVNSGASGTDLAVQYSRDAADAGADALMIVPPFFMPATADEILHYYRTVDAAVGTPIILQDIPQAPVPPAMALRLARECGNVRYIKVETVPSTTKVAEMAAAAGDEAGARAAFDASIMAVNRLGAQGGDLFYHLHKQLLVRLGVIRHAVVRHPTMSVDAVSQHEIDQIIDQLVSGASR